MSTITSEFTNEQLIAKAREQIAFCRNTKITGEGRTHVNQCSALFEIALASLEADKEYKHHSVIAEQLAHVLSSMDATDHQRAVISCAVDRLNNVSQLLQSSPSALLVPETLDYQGAKELYNYLMNEEETNATVNGWNACRAAMLQGADGNFPVIADEGDNTPPHQGWVFTHGGKDYFYRKQSDAVKRLNAAIESGGGSSLVAVIAEPVTTAYRLPMQPLVIDSHGTLRFKENPIVRTLLDYATEHGYGLNEIAREEFDAEDQMQLAQLIGYSLSGYGTLSYVTDESYDRAASAAPQQEELL